MSAGSSLKLALAAEGGSPEAARPGRTRARRPWGAMIAGAVFLIIVLGTVLAPLIAPYEPNQQNLRDMLEPPSGTHWFGTDVLGYDIFTRVLHGGGPPLLVGVSAVLVAMIIGVIAGIAAGSRGGWLDNLLGRIADIQMSIPGLILALLVLVLFGTNLQNVIIVIAIESWPLHFRVVRSHVQSVSQHTYVEASRLAGMGWRRTMIRHIAPSALPLLAVTGTVNFAGAVLTEASLSYLGMGVQPPTADWGVMISDGQTQLGAAWWISVFPGSALLALLLSTQVIGDYLADRFSVASD
ncbi:ABC transporter permease [Nakamurella leprariae]|uniref:ABC transporter permease n=1 Tax=Nakamurella leprariae TaxID=2803911 RepID=A0A939BZV4_9ACTN|nr:ABC transporter permease [Nakamurella leprariae]MBM9468565.1 ABC transporter permease [Nakamurella leprariae]